MRLCPAGCDTEIPPSQVLCDPCWELIPKGLQRRVWDAWTTWRDSGAGDARTYYETAVLEAAAAARLARQDQQQPAAGSRVPSTEGPA